MPIGRQQSRPVAAAQRAHGAVVRVRGSDEAVHVAVRARHGGGRPHGVAPQHVDGVVQALQPVLDATLLRHNEMLPFYSNQGFPSNFTLI